MVPYRGDFTGTRELAYMAIKQVGYVAMRGVAELSVKDANVRLLTATIPSSSWEWRQVSAWFKNTWECMATMRVSG